MSDEQTIYIGPEDDLTNVRERLERISSRRVTLVIPTQTQLRSHVAWKLLHARARELSKDVIIISSDPQIRSVAQAVKFKVANSLESAPVSRSSRPSSRTSRTPGNRGRGPARTPYGRGGTEARSIRNVRQAGTEMRPTPAPQQWSPTLDEPQEDVLRKGSKQVRKNEANTGGIQAPLSSSAFDVSQRPFGQSFDYRIDTTPSIHPLTPEQTEEEPDLFLEDFEQAQGIREAARGDENAIPDVAPETSREAQPTGDSFSATFKKRSVPLPQIVDDPFAYMEDPQHPPRAEQRGSVSVEGFDSVEHPIQDISEYPTSVIDVEIEDMGDQGAFELSSDTPPVTRPWHEEEKESRADTTLSSKERLPRSRRSGKLEKGPPPIPLENESEDELPPVVEQRPVRRTPPRLAPPPNSLRATPPAPAPVKPARVVAGNRPAPPPQRERPGLSKPIRPPRTRQPTGPISRAGRSAAAQRRGAGGYIFGVIAVLILLGIGAVAYFVPSATVTVTLPARDYSHAVKLVTLANGQQNASSAVVVGEVLKRDFTKSGNGTATGTKKIDNQFAGGQVVFTNDGTSSVTIPSGIIVSSSGANSQQFETTANAIVLPPDGNVGNTITIPVRAQRPGAGGNVAPGSITVIPDASLKEIATANGKQVSELKLQVTNPTDMTKGGSADIGAVAAKDLEEVTKTLQAQLEKDITTWVQQQKTAEGDILGKPKMEASLVNPPPVGQNAENKTFPAQVKVTVTMTVIREAMLQDATVKQLNEFLAQDKAFTNYVVSTSSQQPVKIQSPKVSGEGEAMTVEFAAVAKAIPLLTEGQVRELLVGGTQLPAAEDGLKNLPNVEVQNVEIKAFPDIVTWIPFWKENIHVDIMPGTIPAGQPQK